MDWINKLVAEHVWSALAASHVFIAVLSNVDRLIKLVLTYFSAKQINAAIELAAKAAEKRVEDDSQPSAP